MHLAEQSWLTDSKTKRLIAAFDQANIPLRFVGGCVRDAVIGIAVNDIDCATPAPPKIVIDLLQEAGLKAVPTGITHGTITAVIDSKPFEITTLRKDIACDGRHAEVAFTDDWQEDASRRDFTMNALYCDANGTITDFFDGIADAQNGIVRFIRDPARRIQEDALRILRLFRFYASHGKQPPEGDALATCQAHADLIDGLSAERVQQEMLKLLAAPKRQQALDVMQQYSIASKLFGSGLRDLSTLPDTTHHVLSNDPILMLALLIRSNTLSLNVSDISERWKLSNTHRKTLAYLVDAPAITWPQDALVIMKRAYPIPHTYRKLHITRDGIEQKVEPTKITAQLKQLSQATEPIFPVNGDDVKQLGIADGPAIGKCLKQLEQAWINQDFKPTKAQLLQQLTNQ